MKLKVSIIIACSLIVSNIAFAECNATDPCAPKKEKDSWIKSLAIGFNLTSGNSDTTLLTVLAAASRETDQDLVDFNLSYNYGENEDSTTGDKSTSRDDFRADAAYNYKLSPDFYAGFGTKYLHDEVADIDYRVNLNPTLGYFLVKNADVSLALEAGPGYTFEKVAEVSNDYLSPRIADRFEWIISCTSKLFQKSEILLDMDNSDNYIINSELGIEAAISSQLSLVVAVKDLYDNEPAPTAEKNDVQLISALKVAI